MGMDLVRPNSGTVARQDFGGQDLTTVTETAVAAITARETALVQSRFTMAMHRPRRLENVRVLLMKACGIWEFADEGWYSRPAGKEKNEETGKWETKYAEGFSIRFAEEAGRTMGNMMSDSQIVVETPEERVVHVWAMDLETNFTRGVSVSVSKIIERKFLKKGQVALGERENSEGDKVYLVHANPGEMLTATNNQVAKAERQCTLKMIPAWILRDCKNTILATLEKEVKDNPDAAKRKLIDSFAELKVMPTDLEMYLGHSLDRVTVKDLTELRNVYRSINQGESTWEEWVIAKNPSGSDEEAQRVGKLKFDKLKKEAEKTPPATETKPTEEQPKPEQQTIAPAGPFANEDQQMTIMTLAGDAKIPQVDLQKILVKFGVLSGKLHEIPLDIYPAIVADLKGETAPRTEEPKATKGLKFGEKAK